MPPGTATAGFALVFAVMLPIVGALLSLLLGGRQAARVALFVMPLGVASAMAIAAAVWRSGKVLQYVVGGWAPPLGVALRADGLAAAMVVTAALLIPAIGLFARAQFPTPPGAEARAPFSFWTLLLALWAALNAIFLGADLFSLFVALELLTFAAVPLVCLDGRGETTSRGSCAICSLRCSARSSICSAPRCSTAPTARSTSRCCRAGFRAGPAAWAALSLMTAGLLAKAALYPLHLWLPPAHAGAPAPASAVLSGLVVKAPFFIVLRLWFDVMPGLAGRAAAQLLGLPAAAAILFGSIVALRQARLKLLVAYSTVAQIGYLFLILPLAGGSPMGDPWAAPPGPAASFKPSLTPSPRPQCSWRPELVAEALGHDRVAALAGVGRALPITVFAFGLGGLSLIGSAAERRLCREGDAADRGGGGGPVVVGIDRPGGRAASRRLRVSGARPGSLRTDRTVDIACKNPAKPTGGGLGGGAHCRGTRLRAAPSSAAAADRPSRNGSGELQMSCERASNALPSAPRGGPQPARDLRR